ncbi:vacuolar protein sorting-associated protein 41 homolog [Anneissia japonica]|uniref:vacuolar protein sorting-associated protein 41 homolog n=1 Tax=Anneissia japonica TaxID=1529436 RepID=UPI001425788A|nr:vacuolar protein sorting-associated protein 41 homolog [Anneissia japonica]
MAENTEAIEEQYLSSEEDEEEEEDDEEESEEDDDEDESDGDGESTFSEECEEPKLKYERIRNDLEKILEKHAASCMAVHSKFLAMGTHWGTVHVLDHQGNNISEKEEAVHTTTVNQISLDQNGDYIASCSDDGRVAVTGLYESEHNVVQVFDCPIKAVALDPKFSKPGSSRRYVTGGDKLLLHEKGLFNRNKSTVIHDGEGQIRNIQWRSCFIAWSNELGVKVYDVLHRQRITFIRRDHGEGLRSEIYTCSICWKDDKTLIIGWADTVKICVVKDRLPYEAQAKRLPLRFVEIVSLFKTDFFVCGVAPLDNQLVVLAFLRQDSNESDSESQRPQLKILDPKPDDYEIVSSDALSIRGFQMYEANNYHLEYIEDECIFHIVSPKDVVVGRQRDMDDHITWFMENGKYEEALEMAKENSKDLNRHNVLDVGKAYIHHLIEFGKFEEAASMCQTVLGKNKELWEEWVYVFAKLQQLKVISPYVPLQDPRLSKAVYEMILNDFLITDLKGFHRLIRSWPQDLYDLMTIVSAVKDLLRKFPDDPILNQTLGDLYSYDKRYDKALAIYLKLGHKDVFALIQKHNLLHSIQDKLVMLMELDGDRTLQMLVDNVSTVTMKVVVQQFKDHPRFQYQYLDALFLKSPHVGQDFHALQVSLYAEFNRPKLLPFLSSSNYYPLQKALEECEQREFIPETVFLLGRMGNTKKALNLIMVGLKDVGRAIEFAKDQDDAELWNDLITHSMDKPSFLTGLLNNIGTHVDPIILIKRIKEGLEIPGLRDSLVKILQDFNLQMSLREGCKKILVSDCFALMDRLNKVQRRATRVDDFKLCDCCHDLLVQSNFQETTTPIIVFYCHHVFHEDCLPSYNLESCMICHSQRRRPGSGFGLGAK